MKTWQTIATQRAIREFSDRKVKGEQIRRILDSGRRAPSSMNEQRRAFIVVRDRDRLRHLAGVGAYSGHVAGAAFAIALITPDADESWVRESIAFDLGQAAQNMMLAAWDEGIGSCHAAVHDPLVAQQVLGYPDSHRCDYLLSFGYPKEGAATEPKEKKKAGRIALEELRHDEHWLPLAAGDGSA
jgi:nitroreductase